MAGKFYSRVGFGHTEEVRPGVMEDVITERRFYGDVLQPGRAFQEGDKVNSDVSVTNRFSVIADDYANENVYAIRYFEWKGVLWKVTRVQEERPRLIFSLGEVYNGPTNPSNSP